MRVMFRTDASPRIGGGHVMRCLALADALRARGATCGFVFSSMPEALQARVAAAGHALLPIDRTPHASTETEEWDRVVLPAAVQEEDARRTRMALGPAEPEWLVIDHYQLNAVFEAAAGGARRMVIDDLANRKHACDLLLDQTLGRNLNDYRPLVPTGCVVVTGPEYAPLRPEFAAARPRALARRSEAPARRVLVSLGTADLGGITARALDQILALNVGLAIDVVLGRAAPSLAHVEDVASRHSEVRLHIDSDAMAELMIEADLAVGAAGTTSWERCCLALPALVVVLAGNQRFIAQQLHDAGAQIMVDGQSIGGALQALLIDHAQRAEMAQRAARVTDGLGSRRLCDTLFNMRK
ncbi:MAG TPA: UDP-2,4-diacetamido-2,4,6-trideoxy-beta-L-altropyranose hydrolase [Allosphingosinicella sp.]|jgi:UDP-2,4-diacetamido-2,4,6-trideoxy-beta-L-altropyranose hydrolase